MERWRSGRWNETILLYIVNISVTNQLLMNENDISQNFGQKNSFFL